MRALAKQAVRGAIDVVFPRCCVGCEGTVEGGRLRHVCVRCERKLYFVDGPHCTTCGHPFYGEMEGTRICQHCDGLQPLFGEGRTAVLLKGTGRELIHALKYHQGTHVLEDMVSVISLVREYPEYLHGAVLVPVPLHPRKLRERGYNQGLLLAECCVKACGGRARIEELLKRVADTESQTHYDRAARRENLKNAFALAKGAAINPAQRYILVDDVFTTGSTLNACAAVLRRAGALKLDVATFGHG